MHDVIAEVFITEFQLCVQKVLNVALVKLCSHPEGKRPYWQPLPSIKWRHELKKLCKLLRFFSLTPRCCWSLRSSGMLRGICWFPTFRDNLSFPFSKVKQFKISLVPVNFVVGYTLYGKITRCKIRKSWGPRSQSTVATPHRKIVIVKSANSALKMGWTSILP
jgi:hypothetical protein